MNAPVVLLPACLKTSAESSWHGVQAKYLDAVLHGAGCQPLIVPALGAGADINALLELADGVLLTGSLSNVHPDHFGEALHDPSLPLDPARDATTLPLIRAALARGLPLLAICRGAQEVNVALGGSLHQAVHLVAGLSDHRHPAGVPHAQQYAPAHRVTLRPGGRLAELLPDAQTIEVNSLHGQGIARLAAGLLPEAVADDGLIEAYSGVDSTRFLLAVQWHPEWRFAENPASTALFSAFGAACRVHHREKFVTLKAITQP